MKANYEDKIPKQTSEVSFGNLYDVNKQLMAKEAKLNEEKFKEQKQRLGDWIYQQSDQQYFMMLCHERRDYTVFNINKDPLGNITIDKIQSMLDDVIECLTNRGDILAIDLQETGGWEFWIRHFEDNDCSVYCLFPYGTAVLEY